MATPNEIHLTALEDTGIFKFQPQTAETAAKASELLQENHEKHHIFFKEGGFHNHIAHHLLTLYGLGAPASIIEKHYKENASYQRPAFPIEEPVLQDMTSPENFKKYLGKDKYYHGFLVFWQKEMEKKGWENVLNEYLFAGTEEADDLLTRVYAGFLHPLIHLGFGIEFNQPAIIAEALAQAAVHGTTWITPYLLNTEKASKPTTKTLPALLDEIRANTKLSTAAEWPDSDKIRDGILARAPEEMISIASQFNVSPNELEKKTAEMIATTVYFTAAAQNPKKVAKFDFLYIHSVNASIFFPTFNKQSWLSTENKIRLLKFKVYIDLVIYTSRCGPPLLLDEISSYVPKEKEKGAEWDVIFSRLFRFNDDGHAVKLGRAVAFGETVVREFEEEEWVRVKGEMWEKVRNMVVDSIEGGGKTWARGVGFDEAWEDFEDRPRL